MAVVRFLLLQVTKYHVQNSPNCKVARRANVVPLKFFFLIFKDSEVFFLVFSPQQLSIIVCINVNIFMDGHIALSWAIRHIKQTMLSSLHDH